MILRDRQPIRMLMKAIIVVGVVLLAEPVRAGALEPCTSSVKFEFEPKGPITPGLAGKLVLRQLEEQKEKKDPLKLEARVGAPVVAELPCLSKWQVTLAVPGVWGAGATVEAGERGATLTSRMTLWPLGKLAGGIKLAEKDTPVPKLLRVTTLAPRLPARQDVPKGAMSCPLDKEGRWQCPPLPATAFDLVISADGFVPQYRWQVKILPEKTTDVGAVLLKRGASVAGWVEVEGGEIDAECRARLAPMLGPGTGAQIAEKLRGTVIEAPVRKDGFFQLVGVAPGNYALEIQQKGFATATVYPLEVWPQLETFLRQPITLRRPLQVELAINPPLDWLNRPWKVAVLRASDAGGGFSDEVFNGSSDDQGIASIPGQSPGQFWVMVSDALDNRIYSEKFKVAGPEDSHRAIKLDLITLRGEVTLGKEPLVAELWFGGRFGSSAVKMESDGDGKFHGVLPRAGWWRVEIASSEPRFQTATKIKVEADSQGRAAAEIHLPATRVFGKVLDDGGRPVPAANFSVSTDTDLVMTKTDESGTFDVHGLPEGLAQAAAKFSSGEGEWTSDRLALFLRDGESVGPLELRMRKSKRISGTVQSSRGPVPGAGITVVPLRPTMMFGDSVRTELDGTFTANVPGPTTTAAVIVSPPGYALQAFPLVVGDVPQPLTVSGPGGDIEILFPEKSEEVEKGEISLWVFQNGLPIPTSALNYWIQGHGTDISDAGKKLVVPALAPGEYRACLAAQAVFVAWEASGWSSSLAKCATGQLTAGGALRLDLSSD
jgi:hypothetical protein